MHLSEQSPACTACEEETQADSHEVRVCVLSAHLHGVRLDKALVELAPEFSRNHLQSLIDQGCVQLNGVAANSAARKVQAGQRLTLELVPTAQSQAFRAEPMALNVVFEDESVMVINKPAGCVVHPAAGHWSGTLLNGLLAHHALAATLPRAGIVHRLDKDTSGLMMVGKNLASVTALVRAIANREVLREYVALVHGQLRGSVFQVDEPIGRDPKVRVRMAVVSQGKPAQTDVTPLAAAQLDEGAVSAVHCKLHTGRTHQIRVHLAYSGHPLVADTLYGGRPSLGLIRQALHAKRLGFSHPVTGEWLSFESELPADLASAWQLVVQGVAMPQSA
jgi:23S rRNA pseudouridine1911/1915/1917 synthase